MGQSLAKFFVRIVFSTKGRKAFLQHKPSRIALHKFLAKTCNNLGSPCIEVGGTEDHVHILCRLSTTFSVSGLIKELKRVSSAWAKKELPAVGALYWQTGYGAFSISPSHVGVVEKYIQNQEQHHKRVTFQDEFRRLLAKYGIECDERYVWD